MTEQNNNADQQPDNSVSGYYENYNDTQTEILAIELRKAKNTLFTLSAIIFAGDLISLLVLNAVNVQTILIILVVPVLLIGLAFLAKKEPLTAIIIAAVVIIGLWIYSIVITRGQSAIMGWLIKAVIIYFLIAGYQHAREATRIKKELSI
jgi:FtsH-binding integral membrane protein